LGQENEGWTVAKFLLAHERTDNAGIGPCKRFMDHLWTGPRCAQRRSA
jgi:hypothetical protein